jgi:hypothetical protein
MVTMTCCGTHYDTVAETMYHVCGDSTAGNMPAWLVWVSMWLTGVAMAVGVLAGLTVAYEVIADPQEDSNNIMLNCHVYGNGKCGPDAPWHGFINL